MTIWDFFYALGFFQWCGVLLLASILVKGLIVTILGITAIATGKSVKLTD